MSTKTVEIIDLESKPILTTRGRTKADSISVDFYDFYKNDRTLNQATTSSPPFIIDLTADDDVNFFFTPSTSVKRRRRSSVPVIEIGQSSSNPKASSPESEPFVCQICFDPKPLTESFGVKGCTHAYCKECMSSYVAAKLQDNVTHITCPSPACHGLLEPYYCQEILPLDVFERWGSVLCESLIAGAEKFYCPFKDCSALLINDGSGITESECPHCYRLFCAQCKSSWHFGMECSEYQKLDKGENEREDILLINLAKDKKWRRCPKCKIFVEKSFGCMYMKCRCNFTFCYNCGAAFTNHTHMCPKCHY